MTRKQLEELENTITSVQKDLRLYLEDHEIKIEEKWLKFENPITRLHIRGLTDELIEKLSIKTGENGDYLGIGDGRYIKLTGTNITIKPNVHDPHERIRIKANGETIHYPIWEPQKGDYVIYSTTDNSKWIVIFNKIKDGEIYGYAILDLSTKLYTDGMWLCSIEEVFGVCPATPSEITLLDSKLAE